MGYEAPGQGYGGYGGGTLHGGSHIPIPRAHGRIQGGHGYGYGTPPHYQGAHSGGQPGPSSNDQSALQVAKKLLAQQDKMTANLESLAFGQNKVIDLMSAIKSSPPPKENDQELSWHDEDDFFAFTGRSQGYSQHPQATLLSSPSTKFASRAYSTLQAKTGVVLYEELPGLCEQFVATPDGLGEWAEVMYPGKFKTLRLVKKPNGVVQVEHLYNKDGEKNLLAYEGHLLPSGDNVAILDEEGQKNGKNLNRFIIRSACLNAKNEKRERAYRFNSWAAEEMLELKVSTLLGRP
jgi:hypothetical protein